MSRIRCFRGYLSVCTCKITPKDQSRILRDKRDGELLPTVDFQSTEHLAHSYGTVTAQSAKQTLVGFQLTRVVNFLAGLNKTTGNTATSTADRL